MTKKRSGWENKKAKELREKETKKYSGSISKLFKSNSQKVAQSSHNIENSEEHVDEVFEKAHNEHVEVLNEEDSVREEVVEEDNTLNGEANKDSNIRVECLLDLDKDVEVNYDPGLWGTLNDVNRIKLVEKGPIKILKNNDGFEELLEEAKELAIRIGIEPCFPEKRVVHRSTRFDDEEEDDVENESPVEKYRINFFIYIIDQAISSLNDRFVQYRVYEEQFGFLFGEKLRKVSEVNLSKHCIVLEKFLKHGEHCDVNADELCSDLKELREILPKEVTKAIDILNFIKSYSGGGFFFGSAWVAYRILLTIPVSVVSAERSFSKLKLIKNYLRSTMSQQRLSGLGMIAIEKELLDKLKYEKIIEEFALSNARRSIFL